MQNPTRPCVCRHLRSHEMYYGGTADPKNLYHSGVFWCHLSQNGLGPDGKVAGSEECAGERDCFEQ